MKKFKNLHKMTSIELSRINSKHSKSKLKGLNLNRLIVLIKLKNNMIQITQMNPNNVFILRRGIFLKTKII